MLPLSKTLHRDDYQQLEKELLVVDRFMKGNAEGQASEHRRWEYAMALLALQRWESGAGIITEQGPLFDVGGHGSPFRELLLEAGYPATVIDPAPGMMTIQDFAYTLPHMIAPAVFCLSVIEHVTDEDMPSFLDALVHVVRPGGLLFLTTDCVKDCVGVDSFYPPDTFHFNWMRRRIYTPMRLYSQLYGELAARGLRAFGEIARGWNGPHVYDYSFASLAMKKL